MAPSTVWTPEEDEKLRNLVREHGEKKWTHICSLMGGGKSSKQCRRRWLNHLNMQTKKCGWGPEEDQLLLNYHDQMGNKWTEIARKIGGRTDNAVKNRYHALVRRDEKAPNAGDQCAVDARGDCQEISNRQDNRTLEAFKSSLERLRSWLGGQRKRKSLEDAVASAIRAVDANSNSDDMDVEVSDMFGSAGFPAAQEGKWGGHIRSTMGGMGPQSSSESHLSQEASGHVNCFAAALEDSTSSELVNEIMDIDSGYAPDIPLEDGSYQLVTSHGGSIPFTHQESNPNYTSNRLDTWLSKGNHAQRALHSTVFSSTYMNGPSLELSLDVDDGTFWQEAGIECMGASVHGLHELPLDAVGFSSGVLSEHSQTSACDDCDMFQS